MYRRKGRASGKVKTRLTRGTKARRQLIARAQRMAEGGERRLVEAHARVDVLHLQTDMVVHDHLLLNRTPCERPTGPRQPKSAPLVVISLRERGQPILENLAISSRRPA